MGGHHSKVPPQALAMSLPPSQCHPVAPQVPDIMSIIHSKLQEVDEEHVRKAAQQTVYILAAQHTGVVVSSLLGSTLPFDRYLHPGQLLLQLQLEAFWLLPPPGISAGS